MLIILGIVLNIIGMIGVIAPGLPGILLNYISLILLYLVKADAGISLRTLIIFGILTFFVSLLDYILPLLGAKKYGTSRTGIWGAAIGMVVGIVFFPPFGIIFGLLAGAFIGEIMAGKEQYQALRASLVTFLGTLASMAVRFIFSVIMTIYFFIHIF